MFFKKKQQAPPPPPSNQPPKLTQQAMIEKLNAQINNYTNLASEARNRAKQQLASNNPAGAQQSLQMQKTYEQQVKGLQNQMMAIQKVQGQVQIAQTTKQVIEVQKEAIKQIGDPTDLMQDFQEVQMEQQQLSMAVQQIDQQFAMFAQDGVDQYEVDQDLAALQAEMKGENVSVQIQKQPEIIEHDQNMDDIF
ncbi:SNF7 family protein [Spironucleus salmonicida]|uniref:SNF7 family protein n=1 Tax=Spironucleus salmonicida TaxID=348837 RepID=V6M658_9EUKA|nr:SNF7 family protein [Spironucleus salmonicida]|eukprot:EST48869.1 SNF7 family protein [Spironucleus salmonicida]